MRLYIYNIPITEELKILGYLAATTSAGFEPTEQISVYRNLDNQSSKRLREREKRRSTRLYMSQLAATMIFLKANKTYVSPVVLRCPISRKKHFSVSAITVKFD